MVAGAGSGPPGGSPGSTYDTVPYDDRPFTRTHPDVLATVAALHGLEPPPVARCRVLEIGCAVGGNLIPMALGLPSAELVGIDLSPRQIETGREMVAALGLRNVALHAMDVCDVGPALGTFDYVVCHGVYSWVPSAVQARILAVCAERLAPAGVAYVSYNTHPGWHLRAPVRDMMRWHVRGVADPAERVRRARAFLDLVVEVRGTGAGAYAALLREEAAAVAEAPDDYLFHEHLEDHNEPLHFHEFVARAAAHGLAYLDEARPGDPAASLPPDLLARVGADDRVAREQYLDFLLQRAFRRSLLCHAGRPIADEPSPEPLERLSATAHLRSAPGGEDGVVRFEAPDRRIAVSTDDPALAAVLARLGRAWPGAAAVAALLDDVGARGDARAALRAGLLRCQLRGVLQLHTVPPPCASAAGPRPVASPLARLQAGRRARVTNLFHRSVDLTDLDRLLLRLLDGSRDHAGLLHALARAVGAGEFDLARDGRPVDDPAVVRGFFAEALAPGLARLAEAALLLA